MRVLALALLAVAAQAKKLPAATAVNTNIVGGQWFADEANWSQGSFPVYPQTAQVVAGKPVRLSAGAPHAKVMEVRDVLTIVDSTLELGPISCTKEQFEVSPPSVDTDRVCRTPTTCPFRHFEVRAPTWNSDRTCAYDCKANNCFVGRSGSAWFGPKATQWSRGEYPTYPLGTFVNKVVTLHKSTKGAADQLEVGASGLIEITASADDDVFLTVGPTECDPLLEREIKKPTANSDRVCQDKVVCTATQFESKAQTATEPRECQDWYVCKKSEYETAAPDAHNDRKCASITPCAPGYVEATPPDATHDRTCTPCPAGTAGAGGMAKCLPCGKRSFREYQPKAGQSLCEACKPCSDGAIRIGCSMKEGGRCATCAAGSIKKDRFTCDTCKAGTFEHKNMKCAECRAGRHSGDEAVGCTSCATGLYQPNDGASKCLSCASSGKHWAHTKGEKQLLGSHPEAGHVGCSAHSTCDYALQYETVAAGATVNRVCADATICQAGEYETRALTKSADRKCAPCPLGFKCAGGAAPKVKCGTGWYQNAEGQDHCEECQNCPKGFVNGASAQCGGKSPGTCGKCPAGSRKSAESWDAVCKKCEKGFFEAGDRTTCTACTTGRYAAKAGATACANCAKGDYQDAAEAFSCKGCSGYAHTDGGKLAGHGKAGHQRCSPHTVCDPKTEFEVVAAAPTVNRECDKATTCKPGQYQTAALEARSDRECDTCPIGFACVGTIDHSATAPKVPCTSPTTYQSERGQAKCLSVYDCNEHEYETRAPSQVRNRVCASHKQCGKQQYEVSEASYKKDRTCADLTTCEPGFRETFKPTFVFRRGSLKDRECGKCGTGKFMPSEDHSFDECKLCEAGTFEDEEGSAACSSCRPGTVQPAKGKTGCVACKEHFFQTKAKQPKCIACNYMCAAGTIHKGCGFDEPGQCEKCAAGRFKARKSVLRSCQKCPTGKSQARRGSMACNACMSGKFQDQREQKTCKTCKYACPTGQQHTGCGGSEPGACAKCTPGRAKDGANTHNDLQLCSDCAPGTFHEEHGASTCKSCKSGRYQPDSKKTACLDCLDIAATCKIGEYHTGCGGAKPGTCPKCDAGSFKAKAGAGSCSLCAPGRAQKLAGQGDCVDCKGPLFFQTKTGQTKCQSCNYKCPIGQEHTACGSDKPGHCYKCPAGRAKATFGGGKPMGVAAAKEQGRCVPCLPGTYQDEKGQAKCKEVDGFHEYQPDPHATYALKTRVCSATEYETVSPTVTSNRECASHTVCTAEQYETRRASTHFDRRCASLTVCAAGREWETRAAGHDFDRQCKRATVCTRNEYESQALTATSDRICKAHTKCAEHSEWQTKAAGRFHDRECQEHTKCTSTEWQTRSKGTHRDRECSMLQRCPNLQCKEDGGMVFVHHHHTDHEVGFKYHHCSYSKKTKVCTCLCDSYPIKDGAKPKANPPTITFPKIGRTGNSVIWEAGRTWEKHNHFTGQPGYYDAPHHAIDHKHHNKSDKNGKAHKIDPWLETSPTYEVITPRGRVRHALKKCGTGYYCVNNKRTKVPPGFEAVGGDTETRSAIVKCGDVAHYCMHGVKHAVSKGHFTSSGTPETRSVQRPCGDNAYYCQGGRKKKAPCGMYTTGLNSKLRTGVAACNAKGKKSHFCAEGVRRVVSEGHYSVASCSQKKCGSDDFYCVNGERHTVPDFAKAIGGDHTGSTHTGCTRYNCHPGYEFVSSSCTPGGCVKNTKTCPANCKSWFDGCNNCACNKGKLGACTKRYCFKKSVPKCLDAKPTKPPTKKRCVCATVHEPVKCSNGKTYSNSCVAGCAGERNCKPVPITHNCFTREVWPAAKKAWCCKEKKIGCPKPTKPPCPTPMCMPPKPGCKYVKSTALNANGCPKYPCGQLVCKTKAPTKPKPITHNCFTREVWSAAKKAWCCKEKKIGCPKPTKTCPANCKSWFDGCNNCACNEGKLGACTKRFCFKKSVPKCLVYAKPTKRIKK